MLLTDTAIRQALEEGRLGIEPPPPEERYDPVSVDLSLGATFLTWDVARAEEAFGEVPAVRIRGYNYLSLARAHLQEVPADPEGCVTMRPGHFLLAQTLERVRFPDDLAGRVEGKSSLARLGLSVQAAPTIHPGWEGHITLELHHVGAAPLKLERGVRICQLLVESVEGRPGATMEGTQFQEQESPRGRELDD